MKHKNLNAKAVMYVCIAISHVRYLQSFFS